MMGHRKNRKRERRRDDWEQDARPSSGKWKERPAPEANLLIAMGPASAPERLPETRRCGGCREFIEDQEGGRGTCLHPGSGVLSPWTDTESCAFFQAQRGVRAEFQRR